MPFLSVCPPVQDDRFNYLNVRYLVGDEVSKVSEKQKKKSLQIC